ncbi:type II secretion system minor pseudopilin GspK [Sphingomonas immobilis]|nr:type II secretion system minor pseudopilin GspK [Sphingomonas sp. CA1-15]
MPGKPSERGAALLTVLLLVAVIAVLAATALERLRIATKIGGNAIALDQARAAAIATEALATIKVSDLLRKSPDRVSLVGDWSGTPFALPVPGGIATARIVDGGNCFNLNGLVLKAGDGVYTANPAAMERFAKLIRVIGAPARSPEAIAAATADWIDTDTEVQPNGAEDSDYAGLAVPYRTPNMLMTDVSELRAVKGVTPELYAKLRPWICALPMALQSKVNVNTLRPEQAPLLAILTPGAPNVAAMQRALLGRPALGYDTVEKFWASSALGGIGDTGSASTDSSVTSKWFALRVDVRLKDGELEQNGLIDASALPARLVSRQWGEAT